MATGKKSRRGKGRRRQKTTKDETVETQTGGAKQFKLPEGPRIEHYLSSARAWEKKLADLKQSVKRVYVAAASEGIAQSLLKELMALQDGDPIAARHRLESFGVGLKAIGAPFQLNVFDTMYDNDVAQARAEARVAARAGKSPECRFVEGSEAAEAYIEEYLAVQAKHIPGADQLTPAQLKSALSKKPEPVQDAVH